MKESLKGDLFLLMEVEIDGEFQEIAIQIEHQSNREETETLRQKLKELTEKQSRTEPAIH